METLMRFNIFMIFALIYGYIFYRCKKIKSKSVLKEYLNISIKLAILFIFSLTILPISTSYSSLLNISLIPSKTTLIMLRGGDITEFCINIFGNIIMFIPLGFFIYIKSNKDMNTTLLICLIATISVETLQLIIPARYTDIDDIILNLLGGYIGCRLAKKTLSKNYSNLQ